MSPEKFVGNCKTMSSGKLVGSCKAMVRLFMISDQHFKPRSWFMVGSEDFGPYVNAVFVDIFNTIHPCE
jgi:hypothetical protein